MPNGDLEGRDTMRTTKRSFSWVTWLIVIAAAWFVLRRAGPSAGTLPLYGFLLALGLVVIPSFWFVLVPQLSLTLAGGDRDRQRRILQWVVKTPAPGGLKILARFQLALNDQVAGRYGEAEATYRLVLRDGEGDLDPGFESTVRQHLADTIEALGRREEAVAERDRAGKAVKGTEETSLGLKAQGNLLERQHRYDEAVAVYERALWLAPCDHTTIRAEIMMHLVLSSFNAGRPADTVRWAEAVIEEDPKFAAQHGARRMAAVGCNGLGRLDEAERHARIAAETAPTAEQRGESLSILADYVMRRGDLEEAERIAREAEATLPGKKRTPWAVIEAIEKLRGNYDEAIRALEHSKTIPMGHIPALNRRADAALDMELATLHGELGRFDEAIASIDRAGVELARDPKLSVILHSSAALVHALAGRRDEAMHRINAAEEGRGAVPEDGSTQRGALYLLGRAALAIDEPEWAEALLREYHDRAPNPVFHPYLWYHLAECRRRLGDESGGREHDRQAASTRYGTIWERLARERLAGEGVAV
jgi:tetratricopeptide (TPR) repeat protein